MQFFDPSFLAGIAAIIAATAKLVSAWKGGIR